MEGETTVCPSTCSVTYSSNPLLFLEDESEEKPTEKQTRKITQTNLSGNGEDCGEKIRKGPKEAVAIVEMKLKEKERRIEIMEKETKRIAEQLSKQPAPVDICQYNVVERRFSMESVQNPFRWFDWNRLTISRREN